MARYSRASDPEALSLAAEALRAGSVVALPTDTVYGLAVDPSIPHSVERLFALKERPSEVALPLLVGTRAQAGTIVRPLDGVARGLAGRYWPGPLTLVLLRRRGLDVDLGGPPSARKTVGVRLPDHALVVNLCTELGPLAVTSANLHGAPPATTVEEVVGTFDEGGRMGGQGIAVILDGGRCDGSPSTVVECLGGSVRCLRQGAIPWSEIREQFTGVGLPPADP
ncbi:MAG TPA: L-threonylcarbamoyladenylate synthase [Acidimicrobiales bacterium]|nr:L-threonylcarbamoyladenylate synthase [Acidimicrobiales bacterium]